MNPAHVNASCRRGFDGRLRLQKAFYIRVFLAVACLSATALGTVDNWQVKAVEKYPELGVRGSNFNTRFIAAYRARKESSPEFFSDPAWPVILADELAAPSSPIPVTRARIVEPLAKQDSVHAVAEAEPGPGTWPTADQIGTFVQYTVGVIALIAVSGAITFVIANWKVIKVVLGVGRLLYKVFFGSGSSN